MEADPVHPAVARILRQHDAPGLLDVLARQLSGADLTALLMEVVRRRASDLTPAAVLAQYQRDRFVQPAAVDARRLVELELLAHDAVAPPFVAVTTSPVAPLGTHSVVAGVHQNRVVTTIRGSEVAADPTNALALEAAVRRRRLLADDPRSDTTVDLMAVDRVVRAQQFDGPRSFAHFSLLGLVSAGRDTGSHRFETVAVGRHLRALIGVAERASAGSVLIRLTDFGGRHTDVMDAVQAAVVTERTTATVWTERTAARGYYPNVCFKLYVVDGDEEVEVADGGLVDWTRSLAGSDKERLMISGLSLERLATLAPPPFRGP